MTREYQLQDFDGVGLAGLEGIEHRIDLRIKVVELRRKIKELPMTYQQIYLLMFEQEQIKSEKWLAQRLKTTRWQIRRAKQFFRDFFRN